MFSKDNLIVTSVATVVSALLSVLIQALVLHRVDSTEILISAIVFFFAFYFVNLFLSKRL